jgi:hypothetical protein
LSSFFGVFQGQIVDLAGDEFRDWKPLRVQNSARLRSDL